jgi:KpsF/GutQ family protein
MKIMETNRILETVYRTLEIEAVSIGNLKNILDAGKLEAALRLLGTCNGRIVLSGCGTSAMAAKKICHSLNCIERPAVFLTPSDAVHGGLGLLQKGDVLVLISKGGNTEELTRLVPACKSKGASLVAVTENPSSILAREADIALVIKVEKEPCPFNMLATASTLAVIAVFDAICITLMEYTGYTKEQFALIHPAGAVGDRLLGKHNSAMS